jgi:glycolate oxidase iron-sulfur subunit
MTPGFAVSPESLDLDALRTCVHCGICLPQCPTYLTLEEEMDSPRGRVYLMRAAAEGRIGLGQITRHLDLCVGCRACETACPSGVAFGRLLEAARDRIERAGRPLRERVFRAVLFAVLPRPDRMATVLRALSLYQRSGLQRLIRGTGLLGRFRRLRAMDELLARVGPREELPARISARGLSRGRVGLVTGCAHRYLYPGVNRDTARLLSLAGYDVIVPREQGCCGALELHGGRMEAFRNRARALARAFPPDIDWVVTNAGGCGAAMKEYGHWLDEPHVRTLALRTRDVSEMLADVELPLGALDLTVTYHDACHLVHGQRVRTEPRALLRRIPGLRLVDLPESDLCCGSGGVYNLLEPEVAGRLLSRKVQRITETGARVVATGNPGCLLQIAKGCRERGLDVEVVHPVELLARAVGGEASPARPRPLQSR